MSRKGVSGKNLTDTKKHDLLYSSGWKPPIEFTSPARRPNTRNLLTSKLDQFCRSNGKMLSPDRTEHTSKLTDSGCKECIVLVRMQSNLSQELAEKETRLSKCLRLIDDLIQDSDSLKAKLKILEQENGRIADRLRSSEKSRSDSQLKDLANSRNQHVKKLSELSNGQQDKLDNRIAELIKENARLRNRVDELELDKRIITNLKDEAVRSQQFMEKLYNSFKSKLTEQKAKQAHEEAPMSKGMEKDLRELRSKCSQLETSVKESLKRHQAQSQSPISKFTHEKDDEEKQDLRKKFIDLKGLYEASEKNRQEIMLQCAEQIDRIKQSAAHEDCSRDQVKQLAAQLEKWKKLSHEKEVALAMIQKQLISKDEKLAQLKDRLQDAEMDVSRTSDLEQQLISLTSEMNIVRSENTRLRDQMAAVHEQSKQSSDEQHRNSRRLEAEVADLRVLISELQMRESQLLASEAAAQEQLQTASKLLERKDETIKERIRSEQQKQEQIQSFARSSSKQQSENLLEVTRLCEEVSALRNAVDQLEKELEQQRNRYLEAARQWQCKLQTMESELHLSNNQIEDLQRIIGSINVQNQSLSENLKAQAKEFERLQQQQKPQSSSQELIDELILKDMRISQLEEGIKSSVISIGVSEDMVKLQAQNDSLIREVYEKDLALSELQKKLESKTQKEVLQTMETVQSEGECEERQ